MAEEQLLVRAEARDALSQPLRRWRRDAEQLDRSMKRLGRTTDREVNRGLRRLGQRVRRLGQPFQRLGRRVGDLGRGISRFVSNAISTLSGSRLGRAISGIGRAFSNAASTATRALGSVLSFLRGPFAIGASAAAIALGSVFAAGAAGVGFGVKLASDLEQTEIAFTTMLGSAQEAQDLIADLRDFAAHTPFQLPGITTATRQLLAMGFETEELMPTITAIGDAVSALGLGQDGIDRVTRALGQMRAKGVVQAEEMRQLAEAGIPAWDTLASILGTDVEGAMEQVEKRLVGANTFIDAFVAQAGPMQRLNGAMEAQSKTLAGLYSTLKDTVQLRLADTAGPLVSGLREAMPQITQELDQMLADIGPGIATLLTDLLPVVLDAVGSIGAALTPILPVVSTIAGALVSALGPVLEQLAPIVADVLGMLAAELGPILVDVAPLVGELAGGILEVLAATRPLLRPLGRVVVQLVRGLLPIVDALVPVVEMFAGVLGDVLLEAAPLLPIFGQMIADLGPLITLLLQMTVDVLGPLLPVAAEFLSVLIAITDSGIVALTSALEPLIDALVGPLTTVVEWLASFLSGTLQLSMEGWIMLWDLLADAVEAAVGWLKGAVEWGGRAADAAGDFLTGRSGGVAGRVASWVNPFGDTATPRRGGDGGSLASTLAQHAALASALGSGVTITNALVGGGSGDHERGRALDLVGPGIGTYAQALRQMGGFSEFHGEGSGRHLHAVFPAGDTPTPRSEQTAATGGRSLVFNGPLVAVSGAQAGNPQAIAKAVMRQIREAERDDAERS